MPQLDYAPLLTGDDADLLTPAYRRNTGLPCVGDLFRQRAIWPNRVWRVIEISPTGALAWLEVVEGRPGPEVTNAWVRSLLDPSAWVWLACAVPEAKA